MLRHHADEGFGFRGKILLLEVRRQRHIAFEGRCFVLSACQYIRRGAYPADYPAIQGDDPQTEMIRGGSCIVGPLGDFIVEPRYGEEAILSAEIDLGRIAAEALVLQLRSPGTEVSTDSIRLPTQLIVRGSTSPNKT